MERMECQSVQPVSGARLELGLTTGLLIKFISSNDDVNLCSKKVYKQIPVTSRSEAWF